MSYEFLVMNYLIISDLVVKPIGAVCVVLFSSDGYELVVQT